MRAPLRAYALRSAAGIVALQNSIMPGFNMMACERAEIRNAASNSEPDEILLKDIREGMSRHSIDAEF